MTIKVGNVSQPPTTPEPPFPYLARGVVTGSIHIVLGAVGALSRKTLNLSYNGTEVYTDISIVGLTPIVGPITLENT